MKIGILSDIHEDVNSLKNALKILKNKKCDKIICLGDLAGYSVPYYHYLRSRNASEVIKIVKKECDHIVVGNHDLYSIEKIPTYKAEIKYPKNWYALDYQTKKKISKGKLYLYDEDTLNPMLTKADRQFLAKLSEFLVLNVDGLRIFISHYAFPDLVGTTRFEYSEPKELKKHFDFIKSKNCFISISGHDHKEGMYFFTPNDVKHFGFEKVKLPDTPVWLHGPSVANGTFANGVMIFDTKNKTIQAIPLNSVKHQLPDWRKL
ncbi:metallophosphoesterase [Candidatus Woesearchaeota archaeon]|mgnify:CR=1 FL=1|jgi:predicted phosphodiesterase|nr:metallophosphoesterase [Candidatus Woesearchaeota archaeon]MBT5342650.1 metallophosphoesterase [Candidatus Woesearchaeota archaeon]MBT7762381.1 metallophosphoesterase [Candidatus Woesearchaeota archaeon]